MRLIILLAKLTNIVYFHCRSLLEKLGFKTGWSRELARYFKTTPAKIESAYLQKRQATVKLWGKKKRNNEKQIHSFYQETDYFVFRQTHFHRLKIYLDLAVPLFLKRKGKFCEYGGGVGPFTRWLLLLFPDWQYQIADLDCPALDFAKWRFKEKTQVSFSTVTPTRLPLKDNFEVITCKQVLEHVSEPLKVVKHLINHLKLGGWLYLDYIYDTREENLARGAKQRKAVLEYLSRELKPIFSIDAKNPAEGYGIYLKTK